MGKSSVYTLKLETIAKKLDRGYITEEWLREKGDCAVRLPDGETKYGIYNSSDVLCLVGLLQKEKKLGAKKGPGSYVEVGLATEIAECEKMVNAGFVDRRPTKKNESLAYRLSDLARESKYRFLKSASERPSYT